jgi:hypothetical protein
MSCITVSLEGVVIVGTKMPGRYQGVDRLYQAQRVPDLPSNSHIMRGAQMTEPASAMYMGACKYRCAHWKMNLWTRHIKQCAVS